MPGTRDNFYIALIKPQALVPSLWNGMREVLRPQVFRSNEFGTFFSCFLIDVLGNNRSIYFLLTCDLFEELEFSGGFSFVGEAFFWFLLALFDVGDVIESVVERLFWLARHSRSLELFLEPASN